tara:strand:- start:131 stop:511 length:381 start_codon:yes stop_codon:yes gene_type:complete
MEGFKVPSFPPSKAQVPPSQKPATRPDRRPQIRKALRQLLNNLLQQGESMESLRGDPTKLEACERASSVAQAQAKGLQRTAAQFESVGFLSSATQRVGRCVSCAEDALDHCKEVEDLLRLEAQGQE